MKKGFTMIELIFVIVILGILAAVAIPKLAATRDDANIAKAATDISIAVNDFNAFYTAQGSFGNLDDITNVKFSTSRTVFTDAASQVMNGATGQLFYTDGTGSSVEGCIGFQVSGTDGNLTISSEGNTSATCKGIYGAVKNLVRVHRFGGSSVKW